MTNKKLFRYVIAAVCVTALFTQACKSRSNNDAGARPEEAVSTKKITTAKVINDSCAKILTGNFQAAESIIQDSKIISDKAIEQLAGNIEKYQTIKAARQKEDKKVYKEQSNSNY